MSDLQIYYRTSDGGYLKEKPSYVNNKSCLANFLKHFDGEETILVCDNVKDESWERLKTTQVKEAIRTNGCSSAAGFNLCLDQALLLGDDTIVYFCENDYIHFPNSRTILMEAFNELECDYCSLYDHCDKYLPMYGGGETTKVFLTSSTHFKMTISTTMTFAAKVKTLKEDEDIIRRFTAGTYPRDHEMFCALRVKGRSLVTPIPGYCTHGETAWLSPLRDWKNIIEG